MFLKLLFCRDCGDVFNLDYREKVCNCGKTKGHYRDNFNAVYSGESAIPLGFSNPTLRIALRNQPESGWGERFEAFIIPKQCDTFIKQ